MPIIDDVKIALRVNGAAFDGEIGDLIAAAETDLQLCGVTKLEETDPLIKRAVILYAKAHFGYDNPEAERFERAYELLKTSLAVSGDYTAVET